MSTKLNIGIIGLGVGEAHLKSYKNIPNVEVISICDIDPETVRGVFGVVILIGAIKIMCSKWSIRLKA